MLLCRVISRFTLKDIPEPGDTSLRASAPFWASAVRSCIRLPPDRNWWRGHGDPTRCRAFLMLIPGACRLVLEGSPIGSDGDVMALEVEVEVDRSPYCLSPALSKK